MPTPNTQEAPATTRPGGQASALPAVTAMLVSILCAYLLLRPPLFNYDGYIYRLQALAPAQGVYINPHHLLWYPLQKAIAAATSAVGSPSPEAFQVFGILINSLPLMLFCLLLVRLTNRLALPLAMTIFIAFSPRIWNLGMQNQPYPLLDLMIVAFLWTLVGTGTPSRLRMAGGGLALFAAVMLHQAMALVVPAVAAGFVLAGPRPFKGRLKLAANWAGGMALVVAAAYALMARVAGVKRGGFLNWTSMYLREQHGIQVQWPQSAIKSVMGILGTVLETAWIRNTFNPQENSEAIWRLYGGLLVASCAVVVALGCRRSIRERLLRLWRSNASVPPVVMLALAWSLFVFVWEPAGYYWSVNLFPLAFLASLWLRDSPKRTATLIASVLVAVSGWNIYANHRQDQAYSVNFPPPMLEQIRAQLGPNDVLIVAGRDWYANIDFDLLLTCLDDWPNDPAIALLNEYVMAGSREQWQQRLSRDIQAVFAAHGRVFVADHVFQRESYQDLERTADPFSEYARGEFAGVNGEKLRGEIQSFFGHYKLCESGFKIGAEGFLELKRIE